MFTKRKNQKSQEMNTKDNTVANSESDQTYNDIQQQLVDEIEPYVEQSKQSKYRLMRTIRISFKIVVIGQSYVGKTSLIQKFMSNNFAKDYNVTVGAQFCSKAIQIDDKSGNPIAIKLNIWDTCGHDVFRSMTNSFYRGACAVFLVFSVTNRNSFNKVVNWWKDFTESGSPHALIFLIGTKIDQQRDVKSNQALSFLKQIKGAMYFQVSSLSGQNVREVFVTVAQTMYKMYQVSSQFRGLANPTQTHGSFLIGSKVQQRKSSRKVKKEKRCC